MRALILALILGMGSLFAKAASHPWFYQLRIYHCTSTTQLQALESYFKDAYLPALHRAGIASVGVFKPLETSDSASKMVYLFIPANSLEKLLTLDQTLKGDAVYTEAGKAFLHAP